MRGIASVGLLVVASFVSGCKTHHQDHVEAAAPAPDAEHVVVAAPAAEPPSAPAGRTGTITDNGPVNPFSSIIEAVAVVHPTTDGGTVHGIVRFTQVDGGVRVVADFDGLSPTGKHGFHIHEFGDCTGDVKSVGGGHFNPGGEQHGAPDAEHHHGGDFGNLETDDKGHAHYERVMAGITVAGDHGAILGRSVIVHAHADDLTTQPSGNAGDRIGCGIIGIAKSPPK